MNYKIVLLFCMIQNIYCSYDEQQALAQEIQRFQEQLENSFNRRPVILQPHTSNNSWNSFHDSETTMCDACKDHFDAFCGIIRGFLVTTEHVSHKLWKQVVGKNSKKME